MCRRRPTPLEETLSRLIGTADEARKALDAGLINPDEFAGKINPVLTDLGKLAQNLERIGQTGAASSVRQLMDTLAGEVGSGIDPAELSRRQDEAIAYSQGLNEATAQVMAAEQALGDVMYKVVAGPYQGQIDALTKLRIAYPDLADAINPLIARFEELNTKALKQQGLQTAINTYSGYAQQAIPGVAAAMSALGGASDELAGQWGQDLSSMVSDVASFSSAIVSGNYIGAAITALTSIFTYFSNQAKAARDELKKTADYNNQFKFSSDGYGTRTTSSYQTGFLFWSKTHYAEEVDQAGKELALSIENGFASGMQNGFDAALAANDFSLFEKTLTETVGKAALAGLIQAFINETVLKDILGPRIQAVIAASKTPGQEDDIAAAIGLKQGIADSQASAEAFYNNVLKPVADEFGLSGTANSGPSAPQAVQVTAPTVTSSLNLDMLGTLSTAITTYIPQMAQAGRDLVAGGSSNVQSAGLLAAAIDRFDRIVTRTETDWAALRR